jgi:hypothetical protein
MNNQSVSSMNNQSENADQPEELLKQPSSELIGVMTDFLLTFKSQQESFLTNIEQTNSRLIETLTPPPVINQEPIILKSNIYKIDIVNNSGIIVLPKSVIKSIDIHSICLDEETPITPSSNNCLEIFTSINDSVPFGYLLNNTRKTYKNMGYISYTKNMYPINKTMNYTFVNGELSFYTKYPVNLNGCIIIEIIYYELPLIDTEVINTSLNSFMDEFIKTVE